MRKTIPTRIGDLLGDFISGSPVVSNKFEENLCISLWGKVAGDAIASRTTSVDVKGRIMTVRISSPAARNTAFNQRVQFKNEINRLAAKDILKEVIIKA